MASRAKRSEGGVPGWQVIGGNDPWARSNDRERLQARALCEKYAEADDWTAERLAEFYGTTQAQIYSARWLAIVAGLLTPKTFETTEKGKELTNANW